MSYSVTNVKNCWTWDATERWGTGWVFTRNTTKDLSFITTLPRVAKVKSWPLLLHYSPPVTIASALSNTVKIFSLRAITLACIPETPHALPLSHQGLQKTEGREESYRQQIYYSTVSSDMGNEYINAYC